MLIHSFSGWVGKGDFSSVAVLILYIGKFPLTTCIVALFETWMTHTFRVYHLTVRLKPPHMMRWCSRTLEVVHTAILLRTQKRQLLGYNPNQKEREPKNKQLVIIPPFIRSFARRAFLFVSCLFLARTWLEIKEVEESPGHPGPRRCLPNRTGGETRGLQAAPKKKEDLTSPLFLVIASR